MQLRRNLVTGLIGLAMLATPIAAAAKDHDSGQNNPAQAQAESHKDAPVSRSYNMPARPERAEARSYPAARSFPPDRSVAAPVETRHEERREQRAERNFNAAPAVAPAVAARRDWREDRREWREDRREDRNENRWNRKEARQDRREAVRRDYVRRDYDNDDYRGPNYNHRDYYDRDDAWVMPRNYAGGACAWARHLRRVYNQDRYSGHPAAAADLLPRLHRAERACGVPYGYNRWHRYY